MRVFQLSDDFAERQHVVRNLQFHPDGHSFFALVGPPGDLDAACWWDLRADDLADLLTPDDDIGEVWSAAVDPVVSADLELFASVVEYEGGAALRVRDLWAKPPDDRHFYPPNAPNAERFELGPTYERLAFAGSGALFAALTDAAGNTFVMWWDTDEAFDNHDSDRVASDPLALDDELRPTALACSPDGATVAVGGVDDLRVLDFTAWKETQLRPLDPHQAVRGLTFSPDGSLLLVRQGGLIAAWDTRRWKPLADLEGPAALTAAAFSPDGRTLALTAADGTVSLRDAATWAERVRFGWGVGALHSVAFAPDGLTCAAGADHGRVVLWDVEG
jgi:WD40 repeat protein